MFIFLNSAIYLLDICSLSQNSFYRDSCRKDKVPSDELELKIVNAATLSHGIQLCISDLIAGFLLSFGNKVSMITGLDKYAAETNIHIIFEHHK